MQLIAIFLLIIAVWAAIIGIVRLFTWIIANMPASVAIIDYIYFKMPVLSVVGIGIIAFVGAYIIYRKYW